MSKIRITVYAHTTKESNYDAGQEAGLSEEALKRFLHAASEVKLDLEVDFKTGAATIVAVDEVPLSKHRA